MATRDHYPCPSCGAPLFAGRAPDATLLVCKQCAGVWLDNGGSRLAAEARLSELALTIVKLLDESAPKLARSSPTPYRAPPPPPIEGRCCPVCVVPLVRSVFALSGSELETCNLHGTWFDRHELWNVVQAVAIEHARAESDVEQAARTSKHRSRGALDGAIDGALRSTWHHPSMTNVIFDALLKA